MFAAPTDWKYKQLIFISPFCEKIEPYWLKSKKLSRRNELMESCLRVHMSFRIRLLIGLLVLAIGEQSSEETCLKHFRRVPARTLF